MLLRYVDAGKKKDKETQGNPKVQLTLFEWPGAW
jgi:hypothetical protein